MYRIFIIFLFFVFILSSCITNKKLVYLQDKGDTTSTLKNHRKDYKISPHDVLSIKVLSLDDKTSEFYRISGSNAISPAALYYNGFSVNDSGQVNLPMIGSIRVQDLTVSQARDTIQANIDKQLIGATVIVKVIFKFTVLGEARQPGLQYVTNEQVTIMEALAYAGDLTDLANRRKIKLVRTTDEGTRMYYLDVTDKNILSSDFYYLHPNDVLYVQPMKLKFFKANIKNIEIFVGVFTAFFVVLNLFKKI